MDATSSLYGDQITEGQAKVFLPKNVFYNPVQEFNRDLTINMISEYAKTVRKEKHERINRNKSTMHVPDGKHKSSDMECENGDLSSVDDEISIKTKFEEDDRIPGSFYEDGIVILEGLAASGLRSVRFCKEIPGVKSVIANDFSKDAVHCMEENIKVNDVSHLMTAKCDDASMLMYKSSREFEGFDVIDLDPYGGPTKFLDGAVQAVKDGGLLCITCTDMAILCGNSSEKCFAAYGATSLKSNACHELALRIVLRTIDTYANRYSRYIVPLLSVSVDFYIRMFVRVYNGAIKAKESASKSAMIYECSGCSYFQLQPLGRIVETTTQQGRVNKKFTFSTGPPVDKKCEHCNGTFHIGGPLWSAPIHDMEFVERVLARAQRDSSKFGTSKRIVGMLTTVLEELPDVPLYLVPDRLSGVVHTSNPSALVFRSAILNAGYRVSNSHAHLNSLKTDAPMSVIWDILRFWNKLHKVKESRIIHGTPCANILSKEPSTEINLDIHRDAEPMSKKQGLLRYQTGMKDWGPKARASNKDTCTEMTEKRKLNQNKKANKRKKVALDPEYYKQFNCIRYTKEGKCNYGDECKYTHPVTTATSVSESK